MHMKANSCNFDNWRHSTHHNQIFIMVSQKKRLLIGFFLLLSMTFFVNTSQGHGLKGTIPRNALEADESSNDNYGIHRTLFLSTRNIEDLFNGIGGFFVLLWFAWYCIFVEDVPACHGLGPNF